MVKREVNQGVSKQSVATYRYLSCGSTDLMRECFNEANGLKAFKLQWVGYMAAYCSHAQAQMVFFFCDSVRSGGSRGAERSTTSGRVFTGTSQRGQTSPDVVTGKSMGTTIMVTGIFNIV